MAPAAAERDASAAVKVEMGDAGALCRNKAALLARYLGSPSVKQLDEIGSPESREMIAGAREINDSIDQGAISAGECRRVDEALRLVSAAAALAGAKPVDSREQRMKYVERARQFDAYVQAVSLTSPSAWPQEIRRRFAAAELKSAEAAKLAEEGRFPQADDAIESAYREMLEIVRALNDGKMVVHELVFKSPEEEYRYEREKNRSYEMLLQIAAGESGTSEELRAHIARMIALNSERRRAADRFSLRGDPADAIKEIESASRELAKTLRLTGVMVWE